MRIPKILSEVRNVLDMPKIRIMRNCSNFSRLRYLLYIIDILFIDFKESSSVCLLSIISIYLHINETRSAFPLTCLRISPNKEDQMGICENFKDIEV